MKAAPTWVNAASAADRPHCAACLRPLHSPGTSSLLGPPDVSGKVKLFRLCRTCYKRTVEGWFRRLRQMRHDDVKRAA